MNIKPYGLRIKPVLYFLIYLLPTQLFAQDSTKELPDGTEGVLFPTNTRDIQKKMQPNEFDGPVSTLKLGIGYNHDFVAYRESDLFKQQMDSAGLNLKPTFLVRDLRFLVSGVLKTKRYIAWKFAYMKDGEYDRWLIRESGITIGVPELAGHIFIGRTKEGFSMVKVMNGQVGS